MSSGNSETHFLIRHGAKVILGVMILGAAAYISNLTATVWSNERRIDKIEPKANKIKTVLKNQCTMMRHFKIKADDSECI